jgi:Flp pilus assembly protein TadB
MSTIALWVGLSLVLADLRVVNRPSLAERLAPHGPGHAGRYLAGARPAVRSAFRDLVGPLAQSVGERGARWVGISEPLSVRLRRVHSPIDPTGFRLRQLSWTGLVAGIAGAVAVAGHGSLLVVTTVATGGGALAFLLIEQQLANASGRRKQRVLLELPIVSEQLGMLMGAGFSLGSAMQRVASRGSGACAEDLRVVGTRVRQGLTEVDALREWAELVDVDALSRLVAILALNREAGDLGRLVADEARAIRRDVQRSLVEQIERRSQQVWIPVTVATLVPGAVLLAVPFLEAMRLFSNT